MAEGEEKDEEGCQFWSAFAQGAKGREGGLAKRGERGRGGANIKGGGKWPLAVRQRREEKGGAEERGESGEASQGPKKRGKRSLLHPFATFLLLPYPDIFFCVFSLLCRPIAARGKGGERASTFDLSGHLLKIHPSSLAPFLSSGVRSPNAQIERGGERGQ